MAGRLAKRFVRKDKGTLYPLALRMRRASLRLPHRFDFYGTAKKFRIRIRSLALEILFKGTDFEKRGIYPREFAAIAKFLVSAEVDLDFHVFVEKFRNGFFRVADTRSIFNHTPIIAVFL